MILPNVKYILIFLIFFNNICNIPVLIITVVLLLLTDVVWGLLFSLETDDFVLSCSSQALYLIQSFTAGLPGLEDIWYSLKSWLAL